MFHFGLMVRNTYYVSPTLQLAKLEWSQSFYMSQVQGVIPVEGNTKIQVDCSLTVSVNIIHNYKFL